MNKVETLEIDLKSTKGERIAKVNTQLKKLVADYNKKGYKVLSITPLTSGEFEMDVTMEGSGGYGFGYTSGLVVVFEKVTN